MNTYVIISALIGILVVIYFSSIKPVQDRKQEAAKEASKITMMFGNSHPTIFRFDGTDNLGKMVSVFLLLSADDYLDNSFYTSDGYHEITRIYGNDKNGAIRDSDYKTAQKYIDTVKSFMPYSVPFCFAPVSWNYYSHRREVERAAMHLNQEIKGEPNICYSVESDTRQGRLTYIVWGQGKPFKYGTDYSTIIYDEYCYAPGEEKSFIIEVLQASKIKDKTIHPTGKTWDEAFAHYSDGVTSL